MDNLDVLWKERNIFYNILCFLITENEKLFDRSDAILYWKTVFHVITLAIHGYVGLTAAEVDLDVDVEAIRTLKSFGPCFLTGWNFMFQSTFVSLALLHDLLEWVNKHKTSFGSKVKYWRDVVYAGLVVPFTMFVTGMFWSIYFVDRELVFPEVYDQVIPWWFNHCVHTNIFVLLIVETILESRRHPTDKKVETIMYGTVSVLYAVVYYLIYYFAGRWLYKVFGTMTWWQVCIFQCTIWLSTCIFYYIQFPINRVFHSETEQESVEESQVSEKSPVANGNASVRSNGMNGVSIGVNAVSNSVNGVGNAVNGVSNGVNIASNGVNGLGNGMNGVHNGENADAISNISNGSLNSKTKFINGGSINSMSKDKPVFDKSWSLKYRSIRSQFESSSL